MKKATKISLSLLCVIFLGVFAFSGYKLYSTLHEYKVADKMYNNLSGQFVSDGEKDKTNSSEASTPDQVFTEKSPISVDFEALLSQNSDVRGWIYCADTPINYPMAQGEDNNYYLHKFLDGSYNASGTIFLDCMNSGDFSDKNTLIYGHNMYDGSMFASIRQYWQQEYYDAHPVIYINTPNGNFKAEVFSGYVTSSVSDSYKIGFSDENHYNDWLNMICSQSNFETDTEVTTEDRVITLSTCTYEYDEARYVLHAKLIPIG